MGKPRHRTIRLDPTLTDPRAMAHERDLDGILDAFDQITIPLSLPAQLATYIPYRRHLLTEERTHPMMAVGFPADLRRSPLANFLSLEFRTVKIMVFPLTILIGETRYRTPTWVRRLILAEAVYDRARPVTAKTALRILDATLAADDDDEPEVVEAVEAGQEESGGRSLAD